MQHKPKIDITQCPGCITVYYKIHSEDGREYLGESQYRSVSWEETIEKIVGAHLETARALARLKKRHKALLCETRVTDAVQKDLPKDPHLPSPLVG